MCTFVYYLFSYLLCGLSAEGRVKRSCYAPLGEVWVQGAREPIRSKTMDWDWDESNFFCWSGRR
jgi:hypothetical protein